ncbi:hypothetical protein [Haloarcula pellucida]|uniref:Uncharacterized protein n=1 Tax=Haloarcula pellucida TaxID=1427151 RepID=A0A830GNB3_9EURY|nr:hypothetical protein [Halomicroarcula pellucida]MBX0349281.1 hypothetical protein [Halomicroarcula pellucida]GGN99844.1 hypothetical protein GCM10009030_31870 [Halomicroarcula pellucida]
METEMAIRSATMQVTILLLVAAGLLLALGVAGVPASLPLVVLLLALAGGLYLTRPDEGGVGFVVGIDVDSLLDSLWLAPAIAAAPLVLELGATPEEVQALGGLLGLAGMANYFLRPVYLLAYGLVRSLTGDSGRQVNGR